jgi:uncharacterized protein YciI
MKSLFSLLFALCIIVPLNAQRPNPDYDSTLAKKLGADDIGMKGYTLVILKTGPNDTSDKAFRDSCFKSHFSNMKEMTKQGKLVVAGPLGKNDNTYRGIFIMNTTDSTEVVQLLQGDLTIKEKIFDVEMYKWYGSAALPLYLDYTDRISKKLFD